MESVQKSLRIPGERVAAIEQVARDRGLDFSGAANALLEEALRMHRCPGIVFTSGPAGRRATVAGTGLDVWEIVASFKSLGSDRRRLRKAYQHIDATRLTAALAYYELYADEIDERLRRESAWSPEALARQHPPVVAERSGKYRRTGK